MTADSRAVPRPHAQRPPRPDKSAVISGEPDYFQSAGDNLRKNMKLVATPIDPFRNMAASKKIIERVKRLENNAQFAVAAGLAMEEANTDATTLNLLPIEMKKQKMRRHKHLLWATATATIIMLFVLGLLCFSNTIHQMFLHLLILE